MITKLTGTLISLTDESATIGIDPFEYQVLVPDFTRRYLQLSIGEDVTLHTIQYIDGNVQTGGRMTPRLIGFNSTIERQFFEMFCSVRGLGVKKALRAMVRPVQDVARSIEQQDAKALSTLPGIGAKTAETIIAELRRKMAKFALLVPREFAEGDSDTSAVERSILDEVYQILVTLGHTESDARQMLDNVTAKKKKFKDVETLMQAVYDQSK